MRASLVSTLLIPAVSSSGSRQARSCNTGRRRNRQHEPRPPPAGHSVGSSARLEGERPRWVVDEDPVGELPPELAFEARLETSEDVVEAGAAAVGAQHRGATRVASEQDLPCDAALCE